MYSEKGWTVKYWFRCCSSNKRRLVIHAQGTALHKPVGVGTQSNRSWRKVWESAAARAFQQCSFEGCDAAATLGAHVSPAGSFRCSASWYIVPACAACNAQHGKLGRLRPQVTMVKVLQGCVFQPNQLLIGTFADVQPDALPWHQRWWRHARRTADQLPQKIT